MCVCVGHVIYDPLLQIGREYVGARPQDVTTNNLRNVKGQHLVSRYTCSKIMWIHNVHVHVQMHVTLN